MGKLVGTGEFGGSNSKPSPTLLVGNGEAVEALDVLSRPSVRDNVSRTGKDCEAMAFNFEDSRRPESPSFRVLGETESGKR